MTPNAMLRGGALLCLLALTACGHRAQPVPSAPEAQAPTDAGPDGNWHGTSTRFQADGRGCPSPGLTATQVYGRQFQLRWGNRAFLPATIAADGTVSGGNGDVTLTGAYSPGTITVDGTNGACGLHYTLHRDR